MVTTFNQKDLGDFGRYLLSGKREQRVRTTHEENGGVPLGDRLREVYQSDIDNWKSEKDKIITRCKFFVDSIQVSDQGDKFITMNPVMEGSKENKEFWKYTPSGNIGIGLSNEAQCNFIEGGEYYVDFKKA